jgi:hypothetical protein
MHIRNISVQYNIINLPIIVYGSVMSYYNFMLGDIFYLSFLVSFIVEINIGNPSEQGLNPKILQ